MRRSELKKPEAGAAALKHELRVRREMFKLPRFYPKFSLRTLLLGMLVIGAAGALHTHWEPWVSVRILTGHTGGLNGASFSPDGTKVATAGRDGTARIYDVASGKQVGSLEHYTGGVRSVEFSPDGTQLATVGPGCGVNLWDVALGVKLVSVAFCVQETNSARFSPDGRHVAIAGEQGYVGIWDMREIEAGVQKRARLPTNCNTATLRYSADGARIYAASYDGYAGIWDGETGKLLCSLRGSTVNFRSANFAPDFKRMASAGDSCTAQLWSTDLDRPLGSRDTQVTHAWSIHKLATLSGHTQYVLSAAYSPDGTRVITTSMDGTARVWDANTGRALGVLAGHAGVVNAAAYSPDGRRIVTASSDGTARVWELRRPEELYGIIFLPEFWVTLVLGVALCWSLLWDSIHMSAERLALEKKRREKEAKPPQEP